MLKLIPAVIYARYSSSGQREESIIGQLRECHAFADRKGYEIIREYTDEAMTGTNDQRPSFQKMIADSKKGLFQAVIVWKFDRFSRDRSDSSTYKKKLRQNGVKVLSAMEDIGEGAVSSVTESIFEGIAEWYSRNLSENVRRGNMDSAMEFKTVGVRIYGYRKAADGTFELDPIESEVVRRICREYCDGMSVKNICAGLNSDGIKNAIGKPWSKTSLRNILSSEKYTGVYIFKDIRAEGKMPAIISKETYDQIQRIRQKHRHNPNAKPDAYLLSGKLFCGHCGAQMNGEYGVGKSGQKYAYYTCVNKKRGSCNKQRAPKQWIENAVIEFLIGKLKDHGFLEELVDGFMAWQEKTARSNTELDVIHAKQKENALALERIKAAILKAPASDTLISMLTENEQTRDKLIEAEEKELLKKNIGISREELQKWLAELSSGDHDSPRFKQKLVDIFVDKIYLYDNGSAMIALKMMQGSTNEFTFDLANSMAGPAGVRQLSPTVCHEAQSRTLCVIDGITVVLAQFRPYKKPS